MISDCWLLVTHVDVVQYNYVYIMCIEYCIYVSTTVAIPLETNCATGMGDFV